MCDILNRTLSDEESRRLKADHEYLSLSNEVTVRALSASICRRAVAWHIALARALKSTYCSAQCTFPHHLEQMSVAAEMMKEEICFWRQQARSSPPHAVAAGESALAHAGTGYCTTRTPVSTHDASVAASISTHNTSVAVAAPVAGRGAVPMTRDPVLEPDIDTPKRKEDTPAPSLDN
jgi:hypothetical protein